MLPFKKMLCSTDFSEPSYEGVKAANELAVHFSAELCIVHVVASIPVPILDAPSTPTTFNVASYQQELEAHAESSLEKVTTRFVSKDLPARRIVGHGDPAGEIVRIADEEKVDLIVIATHGMTGWRHLIFGSVAEKVVRFARCPVLTVRIPKERA